MGSDTPVLVLCNGASPPSESSGDQSAIVLDYRDRSDGLVNVKLGAVFPVLAPSGFVGVHHRARMRSSTSATADSACRATP